MRMEFKWPWAKKWVKKRVLDAAPVTSISREGALGRAREVLHQLMEENPKLAGVVAGVSDQELTYPAVTSLPRELRKADITEDDMVRIIREDIKLKSAEGMT